MNTKKTRKSQKTAKLRGKRLNFIPFKNQARHRIQIRDKIKRAESASNPNKTMLKPKIREAAA